MIIIIDVGRKEHSEQNDLWLAICGWSAYSRSYHTWDLCLVVIQRILWGSATEIHGS